MKNWKIILLVICCFISIILLIFSISFKGQKSKEYKDEKTAYQSAKNSIASLQDQNNSTSRLIAKINEDPDKLANDAASKSQKFIEIIKKNGSKTNDEKEQIYKNEMNDWVSDSVINNTKLTSITAPKNYDIDVSTSRSDTVPVLVSNKEKYIILTYDSLNEQIIGIQELNKTD